MRCAHDDMTAAPIPPRRDVAYHGATPGEESTAMDVTTALRTRRSVRAFLPKPLPIETVREILDLARRAPSNNNMQPWKVYVAAGAVRDALVARVRARIGAGRWGEGSEVAPYPAQLAELHRARRREVGAALYAAIGVAHDDKLSKLAHVARNFELFGAPVGLFFAIPKEMGPPQWADLGMFAQSVMLLARERGLDSCPQQAWAEWPATLRDVLGIPDGETIAFGMSLGWSDESAPINALATDRAPLADVAVFLGFGV
jgi:nitroreductase